MIRINLSAYVKPCTVCGAQDRKPPRGKQVTGDCRPCARANNRKAYEIAPGKFISRSAKWALANPEKVAGYKANWVDKNPEKRRAASRKDQHKRKGWAPGEHEKSEDLRPFITNCDCCGIDDPCAKQGWHADHNHTTGMFRGFLCKPCNDIIGYIEDYGWEPNTKQKAYLER